MTLSRRGFIKVGGAALTLPLLGGTAFGQAEKLKIGFIYVGSINDNGYNYAHNQGRLYVEENLGDAVETMFVENVPEGPDCERVLRELAQQGCKLIFATSFGFGDSVIKVAQEFPDVAFEHATGYMKADNVASTMPASMRAVPSAAPLPATCPRPPRRDTSAPSRFRKW